MIGVRVASGLLTTVVAAAVVGCAPAAEPHAGTAPPTATASAAPSETLAPLVQQVLPNVEGKTFTSAIVAFPPGRTCGAPPPR